MYVNGIFQAGPAAALVNSTMDWEEGDIIEHEGHFLSFFRADGPLPSKLKTLRSMVDYWQKFDRRGEKQIASSGFFVLGAEAMGDRTLSKLKLEKIDLEDPVVGVVAADTRTLARQFNFAKKVLKRLGVCNDDLPCRLRVETKDEDMVTVRKTRTDSVGAKIAAKLGISLPSNPIIESGVEIESGHEITHSLEQSSAWQLDHGAMKSALLMNLIARGAKVSDLSALAQAETRRNVYLTSFEQGRHQALAMKYMNSTLAQLQQEREQLLESIIKLFEQNKKFLLQNWSGSLRTIMVDEKLFAMQASFENAVTLCQKGQITRESFMAMRDLEDLGEQMKPGAWFGRMGEFGAHAMLLVACLDDAIVQQKAALDLMQEESEENQEDEQAYERPRMKG